MVFIFIMFLTLLTLFKVQAGGLFNLNNYQYKKAISYKMHLRFGDLTITSLKESFKDYGQTYLKMIESLQIQPDSCSLHFKEKLECLKLDSSFVLGIKKIYEYGYYYSVSTNQNKTKRITMIYPYDSINCKQNIIIISELAKEEYKIIEIQNYGEFISCGCSAE